MCFAEVDKLCVHICDNQGNLSFHSKAGEGRRETGKEKGKRYYRFEWVAYIFQLLTSCINLLCCYDNYPKLSGLRQQKFIIYRSGG